jgi:hypothetical protein
LGIATLRKALLFPLAVVLIVVAAYAILYFQYPTLIGGNQLPNENPLESIIEGGRTYSLEVISYRSSQHPTETYAIYYTDPLGGIVWRTADIDLVPQVWSIRGVTPRLFMYQGKLYFFTMATQLNFAIPHEGLGGYLIAFNPIDGASESLAYIPNIGVWPAFTLLHGDTLYFGTVMPAEGEGGSIMEIQALRLPDTALEVIWNLTYQIPLTGSWGTGYLDVSYNTDAFYNTDYLAFTFLYSNNETMVINATNGESILIY